MEFPPGHRGEGEVDGASGQALADSGHEPQIGRAREHTARAGAPVNGSFDRFEQRGDFLHLIEDDLRSTGPEGVRVALGLGAHVEIVQGEIAPGGKEMPKEGALAHLTCSGEHVNAMGRNGLLQQGAEPARSVFPFI